MAEKISRLKTFFAFTWGTVLFYWFLGWRMVDHSSNAAALSEWIDGLSIWLRNHPLGEVLIICGWIVILLFGEDIREWTAKIFGKTIEQRVTDAEGKIKGIEQGIEAIEPLKKLPDAISNHIKISDTHSSQIARIGDLSARVPRFSCYIADLQCLINEAVEFRYEYVRLQTMYGPLPPPFSRWRPTAAKLPEADARIQIYEYFARRIESHLHKCNAFAMRWQEPSIYSPLREMVEPWIYNNESVDGDAFIALLHKHDEALTKRRNDTRDELGRKLNAKL